MSSRSIVFAVILVATLFLATPGHAQVGTTAAQLNGTVVDQSGGSVSKATVALRNVDTNRVNSVTSNDTGYYIFTNILPGRYELSIAFTGFSKYTQTGIDLRVGQIATIDVTLAIAATGQQVVVNTEAPVIEPTRTEVSQVIDAQQINNLPISGRLFTDFALLSPGVATGRTSLQSTFTDPSTTRISFGGQRDLNNMVTVDGADNINTATGSQRATPSQEVVSEFRVVNNGYSTEYGRSLGGIVNIITKSGGNDLHGAIYDYFQNNALDERSPLQPSPQADVLRENQYGATLGGPIAKDKTFFFANYEAQRRAQSPTYPGVFFAPVDPGVAPLFPASTNNLEAVNIVKESFGLPAENLNLLQASDIDNGFIKVDHEFNSANRLSLRYSAQDARDTNMLVGSTLDGGGIGAPSSGHDGYLRDQAVVGTLTTNLTPNLVNSLLGQYARRNYGFPGTTGQPNLDVPNLLLFGHNFGAFDRYNETRLEFSDTVSWLRGKHYFKFGVDTNYLRNFVIWPGFTPSRDIFPSLDDLLSSAQGGWGATPCQPPLTGLDAPCIAAFFWGAPIGTGPFNPAGSSPSVPTTWQNAYLPSEQPNFDISIHHGEYGFFAQDQYRLTPKITVNLGLRWDFESGLGFYVNPDYRSFSPRFGIAYSPNPKTVIRTGFGIFYDTYSLTFFFVAGPQRPPVIPNLPTSENQTTGTYLLNTMAIPTPCVLAGCPPNPYAPFTPPGTVIPPLVDTAFENLITTGSFPVNAPFVQGGTEVDHNLREPYSEQSSFEIDREIGKGFSITAGYLWVAAHKLVRPIDLNVGPPIGTETGTNKDIYAFQLYNPAITPPPFGTGGTGGIFYYTDSTGNSDYNGGTLQAMERVGKYLTFNANYTFSKVIDNGTFTTFVSTPQSNAQRNLERSLSNQDVRQRFVANFVASAPQSSFLRNFEFSSIITAQSPRPFTVFVGFDANNDGNPVTDRVGTFGRNTYFGDDERVWDMRLSRMFHFPGERYKLQIMGDIFNTLNRANYDEVYTVYGAPDPIGPVPHHYLDGVTSPANSSFGSPRTALNPRQAQLAAKFIF